MTMKTLRDLLTAFLDYERSLNKSSETLRHRKHQTIRFLDWLETQYQVTTIDRLRSHHLENWFVHTSGRTNQFSRQPLKPRAVNKILESTRQFIRYLAQHNYAPESLAKTLPYVRVPQLLPTSVLNHAQAREMLSRIPTTDAIGWRDRAMLELLYSTGIRAGELVMLDVHDVDLVQGTALVNGKGKKQRVVPVGQTALRLVESYLKAVRPILLRDPQEQALFINHRGQRLPYHQVLRRVHYHAAHAGLDANVTPHTFRRSCATELIRGGANLYHVKELLGHETLDTLKHYAKLNIDDLKQTHARCHPREQGEMPQ
jgi:site-specific recombinase XerD